ncbi:MULTISPECIES: acyltransferase family protein [unclassified Sphingomonas]|uniref:acyltransferase family protein n=1 Tax=unclassified Sphingomonas TaxID=196159 RepID=UPI0009E9A202|nr:MULTISPECIES: acyltransferase family protein [unclassified Sphingomonas]
MSTAQALSTPEASASSALHSRVNGIDVFRFLAVVGVVFIHANNKTTFGTAFDLASRFGVPFFFIVAGYFAGMKSDLSFFNAVRHIVQRILIPFAVWLVLYLVYFEYRPPVLAEPLTVAWVLMTGGPAFHLWFLPSLAFGTLMLVVLRRFCSLPMLVGTAVVLYAGG